MNKLMVLVLSFQLSSCSFANEYKDNLKAAQLEAEHSASVVLTFLPYNLKLINKLDSKTPIDLKDTIFRHVLFQIASLKGLEEAGKEGFSVNEQMTYRPHIANDYCLINKFLILYKEKNPNAVLPTDKDTFDWINHKQELLLKYLENSKLPKDTLYDCKTYNFEKVIN
ncbi:hypothetical protein G0029_16620 (plasmid) [Acinetobacter sp. YH12138]|uniref:hypothetical protein n=1 Tax=unclassified Acinetobacter TaxID=196816 RepID=UPI000377140F|nr:MULTISPECIES: hypothetical protein [unclassified Acinetobacter]QOW51421.1 hypothetical protein G0029_16620 [Acinetobacter sp. YH12138]